MDIEECKEIAEMGWPENQKAQRQHDAVDWLVAEVERVQEENRGLFNIAEHRAAETAFVERQVEALRTEVERLQSQADYQLAFIKQLQTALKGNGELRADLAAAQSRIAAAEGEVERLKGIVERCNNVLSTVPALEFDAADESDLAQSQIALFDIALIINAIPTKEPK